MKVLNDRNLNLKQLKFDFTKNFIYYVTDIK